MQTLTDAELMEAYSSRQDEGAFGELMRRHGAMVYRACHRLLKDAHEAEDASQAVFVVLARKAGGLRKGDLAAWLYRVAHLVAAETVRKRMHRAKREESYAVDEAIQTDGFAASDVVDPAPLGLVDAALLSLPERCREAVILRYLQNHSEAEAAQRAGCAVGTLSARASRGIAKLRQRLAKRGVTLGGVALAGLLTSEASAAVPETLLPSILATVKTAVATTATGTGATSTAAMLAKGAMKAMFIAKVKMVAAVAAASLVVAGGGTIVAQEVAGQRKAAERPAAAPPVAEGNSAERFASPAWRGDDASHDLARVGIRVFQVGGWGPGGLSGWATPAELRRQTMPATNYVNAWAASQEREVLWLSDARMTVTSARVRVDAASGVSVLEGDIRVEIPGARSPITGERAEFHKGRNTLVVDGVDIPLPGKNVAIIGTKAELDAMKQQAGGETATVEKFLAMLMPQEGPPAAEQGYQREDYVAEEEQATLRKIFAAAEGKAKVDAAKKLCAAGGDDGLVFLKAELSKPGASTNSWASGAVESLGAHGGPEAIEMLKTFLLDVSSPCWNRASFALGRNGGTAAVEILRTALKSDDTNTAHRATCGLGLLGGKSGLELAALALAHTDSRIRRAGAFGAYRAHGERALPLIEKALTDKDVDVRKMAANGLFNMGGDKAADLIQRQLAIEKDPAVVKALNRAFLYGELSKQDASANSWSNDAVKAFVAHGGPEALEMLKTFLLAGSSPCGDRAAVALGRYGGTAAVEILRTALKSRDSSVAHRATFGLEFLGDKAGLELSALALAHVDPKVRRGGAFGAYRAHGERALPLLEKALTDKDADVRKMVANGLANIGGDKAADLIQRQLAIEKDPAVVKALKDAEAQLKK